MTQATREAAFAAHGTTCLVLSPWKASLGIDQPQEGALEASSSTPSKGMPTALPHSDRHCLRDIAVTMLHGGKLDLVLPPPEVA